MKIFLLITTLFYVFQQINADSNRDINDSTQEPNYHNDYVTSPPTLNTQQNTNTQQDIQRQLPPNFSNDDKYETNRASFNNENQVRPKPVTKYSDEQLNLSNPYLVNSNIPKDGDNIPCPLYYPCRTNTEVQENVNREIHQSNAESSPTAQTPAGYPELHWTNQESPQSNQQNSNEGKFTNSEITIVCYGLECSTQIKSPSNFEPISFKTDEINSPNPSYTSEIIKTFESQILKAIINDLQYIRALTSSLGESNNDANNQQKPITIESQQKENIPSSASLRTSGLVHV